MPTRPGNPNPLYQHRHYAELARTISTINPPITWATIKYFANALALSNPQFDKRRFLDAALGLPRTARDQPKRRTAAMPKYHIYLARKRYEYACAEIEAEDYNAAENKAADLVSDPYQYDHLTWDQDDDPGDPKIDEIEEQTDTTEDEEPTIPLSERGFGNKGPAQ